MPRRTFASPSLAGGPPGPSPGWPFRRATGPSHFVGSGPGPGSPGRAPPAYGSGALSDGIDPDRAPSPGSPFGGGDDSIRALSHR